MDKDISQAVIRRMPRYYRYLGELLDAGVERISSNDLSARMHVTASQIRQELNNFGGFGQQGYGYNVQFLHDEIGKILGLDETHNVIVIGVGHLGQAVANYKNFDSLGFKIIGLFDTDEAVIGKDIRGVKVRSNDELADFLDNNKVDIAALTLPRDRAELTARLVVEHGVKGIWNFALVDLDMLENVVVENVHLSDTLMQLSYNITKSI